MRAEVVRNRYFKLNDFGWKVLDVVRAVADELSTTPQAVSLAWLLAQPVMTASIIGANTVEQLQGSLAALDVHLDAVQLEMLNEG